jgi:hypothetical protein
MAQAEGDSRSPILILDPKNSILGTSPPSSLFGSVAAPNSGLLTSINGVNAKLLLSNLHKDHLTLNQDPHGALVVNVNGQPLFSLTGTGTVANGQNSNFKLAHSVNLSLNELKQQNVNGISNIFGFLQSLPDQAAATSPFHALFNENSNLPFHSLSPRQQAQIVASTMLEVLSSRRGLDEKDHKQRDNVNTFMSDGLTPNQNAQNSTSTTPTVLSASPSENHGKTCREIKEELDSQLSILQREHQDLLAFVDKSTDKVAKVGKTNVADHTELSKHLSAGLKRIQSELSQIQFKLEQLNRKQQNEANLVQNESSIALFSILWMIVNTPNVQQQLAQITNIDPTNDLTITDKMSYIYSIIEANIKQQQSLLPPTSATTMSAEKLNANRQQQLHSQLHQLTAQNQSNGQIGGQNGSGMDDNSQNHFSTFSLGQSKAQADQIALNLNGSALNNNSTLGSNNGSNNNPSSNSNFNGFNLNLAPAVAVKRKLGGETDTDTRPPPVSPGLIQKP